MLLSRLSEKKVDILTGHRSVAILKDAVVVLERPLTGGGKEVQIPAKHVILALGMSPENTFAKLEKRDNRVWKHVGDCKSPRNALDAIHDAFNFAMRV